MSETPPMANSPEARTPEGEILNQATSVLETKPPEPTQPEPTPPPITEPPKAEGDKKEPSLLNKEVKDEKKAPEGAPEKYTDFKVPEGFALDPKVAEEAGTIFKELNLSQDAGQKLVDFYAAKIKDMAEAPLKAYTDTRAKWQKETVSNSKLGNGTNLHPEVQRAVSQVIESLGHDLAGKFRSAMDLTGAGDNPAFVEAFHVLSQRLSEGRPVRASGPTEVRAPNAGPIDAAHALYPNLK
jgi:hypothetical protein